MSLEAIVTLLDAMHPPAKSTAECFDAFNAWRKSDRFLSDAIVILADPDLERFSLTLASYLTRETEWAIDGDAEVCHAAFDRLFTLLHTAHISKLSPVIGAYLQMAGRIGLPHVAAHAAHLLGELRECANERLLTIFTEIHQLFNAFDGASRLSLFTALGDALLPQLSRDPAEPGYSGTTLPVLTVFLKKARFDPPPIFVESALVLLTRLHPTIPASPRLAAACITFLRNAPAPVLDSCLAVVCDAVRRFEHFADVVDPGLAFCCQHACEAVSVFRADPARWAALLVNLAVLSADIADLFLTDPAAFHSLVYGRECPPLVLLEQTAVVAPEETLAAALASAPVGEHTLRCLAAIAPHAWDGAALAAIRAAPATTLSRLSGLFLLARAVPLLPCDALPGVLDEAAAVLAELPCAVPVVTLACGALRALADRGLPPPDAALEFIAEHSSECASDGAVALLDAFWRPAFAAPLAAAATAELSLDLEALDSAQLPLIVGVMRRRLPDFGDVSGFALALCTHKFECGAREYLGFMAAVAPLATDAALAAWRRMDDWFAFGAEAGAVALAAAGACPEERRALLLALLAVRGACGWFGEAESLCGFVTAAARLLQTLPPDAELAEAVLWLLQALAETDGLGEWPAALALEVRLSALAAGWGVERPAFEAVVRDACETEAFRSGYHRNLLAWGLRAGARQFPDLAGEAEAAVERALATRECPDGTQTLFDILPAPIPA
jgi:hypothetical protein